MSTVKCTSCHAPLAEPGATEFKCPECAELIRRCARCRLQSIPYVCKKCGFQGP